MATKVKRKHKLKVEEPLPHIEGDFDLVACDLGLQRPGFASIHYNSETRMPALMRVSHVANVRSRKAIGKILSEIINEFADYIAGANVKVIVRERAFTHFNAETQALYKVVGATDMALWQIKGCSFQEMTPSSIKVHVTGSGKATKEEIAEAIGRYCEECPEFAVDDESDAAAVGIAWLIKNGYVEQNPLEKYTSAKPDGAITDKKEDA